MTTTDYDPITHTTIGERWLLNRFEQIHEQVSQAIQWVVDDLPRSSDTTIVAGLMATLDLLNTELRVLHDDIFLKP